MESSLSTKDKNVNITRSQEGKEEYGDWQTSLEFAISVCSYLKKNGVFPKVILEPTCGKGNFIKAALSIFDTIEMVIGIEIYEPYIDSINSYLYDYQKSSKNFQYKIFHCDIFSFDFSRISKDISKGPLLVIGNPPWATNSDLGRINSMNLPTKTNYKGVRGIDAITGKGNFDIAESICNLMFEKFSSISQVDIALLIKNSVIKNIITHQNSVDAYNIGQMKQLIFDARKEFNVSVSASLFCSKITLEREKTCKLFDFYSESYILSYGWVNENFVSNLQTYNKTNHIDGLSQLIWRSGLKHDCSKVMELTKKDNVYHNGYHEIVDINTETIYPFLKSSDIGHGYQEGKFRKYVVLPQTNISEDTKCLKDKYPKTYNYLLKHSDILDGRKSIIYKNKPQFCVFGLGKYSFQKYKIVISSLYKTMIFSLVKPINDKIVLLDDTCYSLGFDDLKFAEITLAILNSGYVQKFMQTICFSDAKRIVSRDLLMRIDLLKAMDFVDLNNFSNESLIQYKQWLKAKIAPIQTSLF